MANQQEPTHALDGHLDEEMDEESDADYKEGDILSDVDSPSDEEDSDSNEYTADEEDEDGLPEPITISDNEDEEGNGEDNAQEDDERENVHPEGYFDGEMYKIWKKNAPFLYDRLHTQIFTHSPSLTVEWMKSNQEESTNKDKGKIYEMVIGTQSTGDDSPNYLIIARAHLPDDLAKSSNDAGGYGAKSAKVESFIKIPHDGDVNKARIMPQNSFHIATKSSNSKVLLFDYSKHSSEPEVGASTDCRPELIMNGHTKEGFALAWNHRDTGHLVSGSEDNIICLYDTNQRPQSNRTIEPLLKFTNAHGNGYVCDVQWHHFHGDLFASVGTDSGIKLWDRRKSDQKATQVVDQAHEGDINSISFNPFSPFIFVTASADKTCALWDTRNLKTKLHSFKGHEDEVIQVNWSPHYETVFASSSTDKRILIWDLKAINRSQTPQEAEEGPPELMFIHAGHIDNINDFSFNPQEHWLMASVGADNLLHIWKMGEHFVDRYNATATAK